ncbi:MAG: transketolase [Alphaproteobacteria bacterium]|nr:transketolase [Alphaproteobacteria bacterium]
MSNTKGSGETVSIERLTVNTIKGLAMDAVQAANSGHPGMPMGMADAAYVLWHRFLKHDPGDPGWPDRDRFILSAGHGSMLLYALLHLTGYDLPLSEIKQFRQWGSRTPGHPEYGHTVGVETTTGPLGQGFANGVGMAIAERRLRARFGADVCDHRIFAIVSDGDLMEGVACEAASLAGHLGLGRLVYLYDDNAITIDGATGLSFTEDRAARFAACGWHVQQVDGHDQDAVAAAIQAAIEVTDKPSLICCRTRIGHGSPNKEGSEKSHGAPLGVDEVRLTKERLGMDPDAQFVVPQVVLDHLRAGNRGRAQASAAWRARLSESPRRKEWASWHAPVDVDAVAWPDFAPSEKGLATRKASHKALNAAAAAVPRLIGGSADLAGSNGSQIGGGRAYSATDPDAENLYFGVREHAMGAICNGLALHGGMLPFCATFLVFHDYMRPAVRLAGLMGQQVIYIYTHDSIYLGEDGPTHQPVEHLMAMRLIPELVTLRPADANETVEAWKVALAREDGPTAIVLTRQNLPILDRAVFAPAAGLANGAYVLADVDAPQVVLIGTGSEVTLALQAQAALAQRGVAARVVSMPSWALFEAQSAAYRAEVLPAGVPRVSIEAGRTLGWQRWVGDTGASVGVDRFGASAPAEVLGEKYGLTVDHVVEVVEGVLAR